MVERKATERLQRNFVSTVSHELRTPLTSIHGSLRLLLSGALGPVTADADAAVRIAERNTARLLSLVNDILDCERLDAGQDLRLAPVAVATLVGQAVESVQLLADEKALALERPDVSGTVQGDADRLVQVLVNLLANAIRFSPRHGVVTIAAAERFGSVEVTVRDRGRGIPADQRALVFEPFHQVDASDARARGGSGLGLAICRRIVDRHHGAIGVESVEGEGSTFWFRIPAAPAVAAEPARRQIAFATGTAR